MPGDLAAFRVWAATDPAQPEAQWNTALFPLPEACTGKLLILTDMPGEDADPVSGPLAPAPGRFIGAMLAAIGLPQDQAAFATLALRRPPGGLLDESDLALLGGRLRHFLDLAAPRAVLILGDRTNRATFGTQRESHIKNLTEIRVGQGMIKLAALASPEHLMRRPAAKANSWASLRLLKGVFDA